MTSDVTPFDVTASAPATATVALDPVDRGYNVEVHGPNGFLAHATGNTATNHVGVDVQVALTGPANHRLLRVRATNHADLAHIVQYTDISGAATAITLPPGGGHTTTFDPPVGHSGWYDRSVMISTDPGYTRRFAGHSKTGHHRSRGETANGQLMLPEYRHVASAGASIW